MSRTGLVIPLLVTLSQAAIAAQDSGERTLETVIVTASRSEQNGRLLAQSWSRLGEQQIDAVQLQHSNQLFHRVAGSWISRGNGQESLISLRSPVLTGAGSCGAFVTAEDGISLRAPGFCNVNQLFDANLAQAGGVEVLRGPDSAVFGSNAMHGVINVLTRDAAATGDRIQLESGSRDYFRAQASLSDIDSGLALNAQGVSYGGYQNDSGFYQQKITARWDGNLGEWRSTGLLSASNLNQETAGFITGFNSYRDNSRREINPNPEAFRDAWSARAYVRAERDLRDGIGISVTGYARDNSMRFLQHFLPWQAEEQNGHHSIGVQSSLDGAGDNIEWRLGFDIDHTLGRLLETQDRPFSPNQPAGTHYDYTVRATVSSAWGQLAHELAPGWRVQAGARLENTRYEYDNRATDGSACSPEAPACRFYRPADRRDQFLNWTGNVGILRELRDHQLYARLARGFRAPQTAELYRLQGGQVVADIDPESMHSVELGARGELTTAVSYAVNGYWMQKRDVIFQDADRFNVSGAQTVHRGIEVEGEWRISETWRAALTGAWASHRYDSNVALLGTSGNIQGNDIDTAPRHFGSLRLNGDFASRGLPIATELELTWLGEYYLEPDNAHQYNGHSLLNWRNRFAVTERVNISLVVTNLTDRRYAERADFGFGSYRYFVGEPRSILLGLQCQL